MKHVSIALLLLLLLSSCRGLLPPRASSDVSAPQRFTGNGADVVDAVTLGRGLYTVEAQYRLTEHGFISIRFRGIGTADFEAFAGDLLDGGQHTDRFPIEVQGGRYLIEVGGADVGNWTLVITGVE